MCASDLVSSVSHRDKKLKSDAGLDLSRKVSRTESSEFVMRATRAVCLLSFSLNSKLYLMLF